MKTFLLMLASLFLLTSGATAQDSLRQRNRDKATVQKRDRVHQDDHLQFRDGQLYRVQQGVRTQVKDPIRLQNGGVVNPDGSYELRDQKRQQMRSGECLDMSGKRYQNESRFNQRRTMTQQQMDRGRGQDMNQNRPGMGNRTGGNRRGGRG